MSRLGRSTASISTALRPRSCEPSYAHPEAPSDVEHDCLGCADVIEGRDALCADCRARYVALGAVEWPELSTDDAEWLDRVDGEISARRVA